MLCVLRNACAPRRPRNWVVEVKCPRGLLPVVMNGCVWYIGGASAVVVEECRHVRRCGSIASMFIVRPKAVWYVSELQSFECHHVYLSTAISTSTTQLRQLPCAHGTLHIGTYQYRAHASPHALIISQYPGQVAEVINPDRRQVRSHSNGCSTASLSIVNGTMFHEANVIRATRSGIRRMELEPMRECCTFFLTSATLRRSTTAWLGTVQLAARRRSLSNQSTWAFSTGYRTIA